MKQLSKARNNRRLKLVKVKVQLKSYRKLQPWFQGFGKLTAFHCLTSVKTLHCGNIIDSWPATCKAAFTLSHRFMNVRKIGRKMNVKFVLPFIVNGTPNMANKPHLPHKVTHQNVKLKKASFSKGYMSFF